MRTLRLLVAAALLGAAGLAPASGPKVHRFASGEASRFSNAYWFRTERGSVLVDAPFLAAEGRGLRAEMSAAGALPLGAVILTSGSAESSWGLGPVLANGTRVWGSRSAAARLEGEFAAERERRIRAGVPTGDLPRVPPRLTNTFSGSLNLGFEGYTLRLSGSREEVAPAVTVVFVPETGELFTGSLVWSRVHPVTGGADLGAWRRALAELLKLGPRVVYPGHGEPGTSELLVRMSEYLGNFEEAVRPLAARPSLARGDVAALRRAVARRYRDWLLPEVLDAGLRAEHARLRRLLTAED